MNNYKIIKKYLHKSFYSTLIKAINKKGQLCMIKKIPIYCDKSEIIMLKKIKHPNIVKYYDSFVDEKYYYLVQEYISGYTIEEYINNKKTINDEEIKNILIELIRAIKCLNYQNIYHLDIRPCNVMYDQNKKITLIDFGCAIEKIKKTDKIEKDYFGIMNHLPPEYITSKMKNIEKVDIWGIGIVLYYIIFKTVPFLYSKDILTMDIEYGKCNSIFLDLLKNILVKDETKRYTLKQIEFFLEEL